MIPGVVIVLALALGIVGCGDDGGDGDGDAPAAATGPERLCTVVEQWSEDLTRAVNRFRDESRDAAGTDERRAAYLAAFDRVAGVTATLRDEVDAIDPGPVRDAMLAVVADAEFEVDENTAEAVGLQDAAFAAVAVSDGSLYTGAEKMRSIVLKGLNQIGRDEALPELEGDCGRGELFDGGE